jgi:hypothetical protein
METANWRRFNPETCTNLDLDETCDGFSSRDERNDGLE